MDIDYNEQMLNYYPEVIKAIREFQRLMYTASLQVEELHLELTRLLANAYIETSDETTIKKWESVLGITPLPQDDDTYETWLQDRRETILARLYKLNKLNEASISEIVKIFTGGEAISYFKNGTVYVKITPPAGNKQYKFVNVENELSKKIPAHLAFNVSVNYYTWAEINTSFATWNDLHTKFTSWQDGIVKTL